MQIPTVTVRGYVESFSHEAIGGWVIIDCGDVAVTPRIFVHFEDDKIEFAGQLASRLDLGGTACGFRIEVPAQYAHLPSEEFVSAFRGVFVHWTERGGGRETLPLHKTTLLSFLRGSKAHHRAPVRKMAILVRTHLGDAKSQDLCRKLSQLDGVDVFPCVDETKGPVRVASQRHFCHSIERLKNMGLGTAERSRALYDYGDFPFYAAFLDAPEYDFFLMIEYDVDFNPEGMKWLQSAVHRIVNETAEPLDFFAPAWEGRGPAWYWYEHARKFFPEDEIIGVLFPIVGLSRAAIAWLYSLRLLEAQSGHPLRDLPYCEYFVPTSLRRAARFRMASGVDLGLPVYDPGIFDNFTVDEPLLFGAPDDGQSAIRHPVLGVPQYLGKLKHFTAAATNQAEWRRMLGFVRALPPAVQEDPIVVAFLDRAAVALAPPERANIVPALANEPEVAARP